MFYRYVLLWDWTQMDKYCVCIKIRKGLFENWELTSRVNDAFSWYK